MTLTLNANVREYPLARAPALARLALPIAAAAFFVAVLAEFNVLDPDLFHEMALFREALRQGHVPTHDVFAYTPTVNPVVHHEWGTGAVLYAVSLAGGAGGLLALRYVLAATVAGIGVIIARRRGAGGTCIALVALPAAVMGVCGLATIRAQDFTMLFAADLLLMLDRDRQGSRAWIAAWLIVYLIWLNMHAGFVAGIGILGAYVLEELIRRRSFPWRLIALFVAMAVLTLLNPYGINYPRYLWGAILLPRDQIGEWGPIWRSGPAIIITFVASVLLASYALSQLCWRRMPGLVIWLCCMFVAGRQTRNVSLFGLACLAYLPAWLQATRLGSDLQRAVLRRPITTSATAAILTAACLVSTYRHQPWKLRIPAQPQDWQGEQSLVYPYGAIEYLRAQQFHGNVMTPFMIGGFVSWELHPNVLVSLDGRYEVAYPRTLLPEVLGFYRGNHGWQATLARYPTDIVLAPASAPITRVLGEQTDWRCTYTDGAYYLFARPGVTLSKVSRRQYPILPKFP